MKPGEAYCLAQQKIENLLEKYQHLAVSQYELVSQLMTIVATTSLEVSQSLVENMARLSSPQVLYLPVCPRCNAELIKQEDKMWADAGIPDFFDSKKRTFPSPPPPDIRQSFHPVPPQSAASDMPRMLASREVIAEMDGMQMVKQGSDVWLEEKK